MQATLFHASVFLMSSMIFMSSCKTNTAQHSNDGYVSMFDGTSLKGWRGDSAYWSVENNAIVGRVTPATILKWNTFLIWEGGQPADFEFKAEFMITPEGNSGVNYRSEIVDEVPYALKGYQADIDGKNVYTGQNYEERGRAFLAKRGESVILDAGKEPSVSGSVGNSDSLKSVIRNEDWNEIHIVAKGNHLRHYINGVLMSEVTDNDQVSRKAKGHFGVQVHVGPPMNVRYRNLRIRETR